MEKRFFTIASALIIAARIISCALEINLPPRKADAPAGKEIVAMVCSLPAVERDSVLFCEIAQGNIPEFIRNYVNLTDTLEDAEGKKHQVTLYVLPDFLAIGEDSDFIRMPTLPGTAGKIADLCGALLPTRRISDLIHKHSILKMTPHPMTPDSTMTTIPVFARHDSIIEVQRNASGLPLGVLKAGHKKDIVITNRLAGEPERLFIYGWHYPDGKPIQPLSAAHGKTYVDYSHGVRLVSDTVVIDGSAYSLKAMLRHPVMYALFSDENGPMRVESVSYPR